MFVHSVYEVHRSLIDCLDYCDEILEGQLSGIQLDAISKEMSSVSNGHYVEVFDSVVLKLGLAGTEVQFDGIAGNCWLAVAWKWIHRFMSFLAQETGRSFGPSYLEGTIQYSFTPPIFNPNELATVKILFLSPDGLKLKLNREVLFVAEAEVQAVLAVLSKISPGSREANVLVEMFNNKIKSPQSRLTQKEIVRIALRGASDVNDNRRVFKRLTELGLIEAGENKRGVFLTQFGQAVAWKLTESN